MAGEHKVRELVYRWIVERERPPGIEDVANTLGVPRAEAGESFRQLASRRLLVLAPGSGEIVMAPPFSANPTPFRVAVGQRSYFANCVWDAYGIATALHEDAEVDASCGCCGEPMRLLVRGGEPVSAEGLAHFAVPAAHWWDDITYT